MSDQSSAPEAIRQNIRRIIEMEEASINGRSFTERLAEAVGGFIGTGPFVALHVIGALIWVGMNLRAFGGPRFDPYPFNFLSSMASIEGVVLTGLVLMKQRRMSRLSDRREHLDLQVNLLAEREISLLIQMVDRLGARVGVEEGSPEAMDLSRTSTTTHIVEELHRHFPDEPDK